MPSADSALDANKFLHEPIAVSFESSRFKLPVDMQYLHQTTVEEYLRDFCKVQSRRRGLYDYFFRRHDTNNDGLLSAKEVQAAVVDVYNVQRTSECIEKVIINLKLNVVPPSEEAELEEGKVGAEERKKSVSQEKRTTSTKRQKSVVKKPGSFDIELFKGLAALVERVLYVEQMTLESGKNIGSTSSDETSSAMTSSSDNSGGQFERQSLLEKTDFDGLGTKLEGVSISEEMRTLFWWLTGDDVVITSKSHHNDVPLYI